MISIRNSIDDLQKSEELRQLVLDSYLGAIENVAHYAIELDAAMLAPFKANVATVADEVRKKGSLEALVESRATLRALLRNYRDRASEYLNQLRSELANTASALQRILDTLSQSEGDHEAGLKKALRNMREIAAREAAAAFKPDLESAIETIEQSVDQMRAQQQMTVSQLLLEISLLHKRIDALESAVSIDNLTKLLTRTELEHSIRSSDSSGSLLLIRVEGFRLVQAKFAPAVAAELVGAFTKRLRNCVMPSALIGRWAEDEFVVMLPTPKEETVAVVKLVAGQLSGSYVCLQGGKTVRPTLQVDIEVLELARGQGEDTMRELDRFLQEGNPQAG